MTRFLPPFRTLLPAEHGTWFMLGFPLVLGLLLRPSAASLCLGLAAMAFFLSRPALRRVLNGQKDSAQFRALLLLGGLALGFGGLAWLLSDSKFLIPLTCISPLVFLALRADLDRAVRSLSVEIAAQGAFAGLAAAMLMTGGDTLATGIVSAARTWWLITLVGSANLAHVRRILGQAHGMDAEAVRRRRMPVHILHGLLLISSLLLVGTRNLAGSIWTAWTLLLYLRALAPYRPTPARRLGWREGGLSAIGLLLLWRALA